MSPPPPHVIIRSLPAPGSPGIKELFTQNNTRKGRCDLMTYESRQTSQLLFCKFSPFSDMKADIVYHWLSIYDNWDNKSLTRNFSLGITLMFLIVGGVYFQELRYFTTDILSWPPHPHFMKIIFDFQKYFKPSQFGTLTQLLQLGTREYMSD